MTGRPWKRLVLLTASFGAVALSAAGETGALTPAQAPPAQQAVLADLPADGRLDVPPLPVPTQTPQVAPKPVAKPKPPAPPAAAYAPQLAEDGIPTVALDAYRKAEQRMKIAEPDCHQRWVFVAAIGRVESDHGRFGGARLRADGTSDPKILGVALNGAPGFATVRDTDHGVYDGDKVYDRAVGPMQFIPSTWAGYAADGNGDGKTDPFNIFDAALAAAAYLCNGHDMATPEGQQAAIHNYNHSDQYVALVLAIAREYAHGVQVVTLPPEPGHGKLPKPPKGPQPPATVGDPPSGKPGNPTPPTTTPPPTTTAPPTSEPPTSEPPTSEPPTGDPPTSDPPTSDPPTDPPTTTPDPPPATTPDPPVSSEPPTSSQPTTSEPPTTSAAPPAESTSAAPSTSAAAPDPTSTG